MMDPNVPYTETLVALDFGKGDIDALLASLGAAVVAHERTEVPNQYRGATGTVPCHRVVFDRRTVRNTHAHALGCAHGFICHVEF